MKDFLLIGNTNAITYKEIFPLIKNNVIRTGYKGFSGGMNFHVDEANYDASKEKQASKIVDGKIVKNISGCIWYTTLPTPNKKRLVLTKKYSHNDYPHYDNYNAINVDKVKDIPYDYECVMGVPITIFGYDLDNVEVMKDQQPERLIRKKIVIMGEKTINGKNTKINGKEQYRRVCIRLIIRRKN